MALIEWNDSFSVGVATIDAQHAGLVNTLNELHDAMMGGHGRERTEALLTSLIAYTKSHFACEEAMLEAAGYADLEEHRVLHRKLTEQVQEYVERYQRGESTVSLHLLNFLRSWLVEHILQEDKAYAPTLAAHGAQKAAPRACINA